MDPRLYPRMVFKGPQSAGTRPWQLSASRAPKAVQQANTLLMVAILVTTYCQVSSPLLDVGILAKLV
jgi:hypothetical protein